MPAGNYRVRGLTIPRSKYGLSKFLMGTVSDRSNSPAFLPVGLLLSAGLIFVMGLVPWATALLMPTIASQSFFESTSCSIFLSRLKPGDHRHASSRRLPPGAFGTPQDPAAASGITRRITMRAFARSSRRPASAVRQSAPTSTTSDDEWGSGIGRPSSARPSR